MAALKFPYGKEVTPKIASNLSRFMDEQYRALVREYGADGADYGGHIKKFLVSTVKKLVK